MCCAEGFGTITGTDTKPFMVTYPVLGMADMTLERSSYSIYCIFLTFLGKFSPVNLPIYR